MRALVVPKADRAACEHEEATTVEAPCEKLLSGSVDPSQPSSYALTVSLPLSSYV